MGTHFDPDEHQKAIDGVGPAEFAVLIARVIQNRPSSQYWNLVNLAIEMKTGWASEHEQVATLIERIASQSPAPQR